MVIAAQLFLAYLIPEILAGLNYNDATNTQGEYLGYYDTDIKNTWPPDYDYFYDWHLDAMQESVLPTCWDILFNHRHCNVLGNYSGIDLLHGQKDGIALGYVVVVV